MNEEEFRTYLITVINQQGNNFTEDKINQFINDLSKLIPKHLEEDVNLLNINDIDILKSIKNRLTIGGDLYHFHRQDANGRPSSALGHYIKFLRFKMLMKQMDNYDTNPNEFDLNGATIFFKIDKKENIYPVKAICKKIYNSLDLPEDYRTNGAKSKLEQLFNNYNIKFIDISENKLKNNILTRNTKNIILYGPPGVGKTHNYQNLISMIEDGTKSELEIFDIIKNNDKNIELNQENFNKIKNENRVEFVTFHQSYSYEDFIEGFRPKEDGNIKLEDGIFKNIINEIFKDKFKIFKNSLDTIKFKNYNLNLFKELSGNTLIKNITHNDIDYFIAFISTEIINISFNYKINGFEHYDGSNILIKDIEKVYELLSANISFKNIMNLLFKDKKIITTEEKMYAYNLLNLILSIENTDKFKELQKNYYLVIDEINRGNISKIFGELITLIEEDKRDIYEVTLPYSKESFKIPSNLYIIATMNSSDKSIATIDIALRRRFTFLNMLPNSTLVKDEQAKELMEQLNIYIKDKIGIDYMLGHSYFMKVHIYNNLKFVIEYKIKPLLEEYFYADEKTADEIIKEAKEYKQKGNSIE